MAEMEAVREVGTARAAEAREVAAWAAVAREVALEAATAEAATAEVATAEAAKGKVEMVLAMLTEAQMTSTRRLRTHRDLP